MRRTGTANLPLHYGHAPRWLFERMVKLSGAISEAIVLEYGPEELLKRLADPFWFQSFACVIGFDYHSSGTTTTACGALKIGLPKELGISIAGGKGRISRKAPQEIAKAAKIYGLDDALLVHASKMAAKVDSACVQDSYSLYHHCFFLAESGEWAVVQQGIGDSYARRYHWLSQGVKSFVEEPHSGIACEHKNKNTLDLTAELNKEIRQYSIELAKESPVKIEKAVLTLPRMHKTPVGPVTLRNLRKIAEIQPQNYEELVGLKGIGAASLRALALTSSVIYGKPVQWKDPVSYSFAHGGKDGYPYPVERERYDRTLRMLKEAIEEAKLGKKEREGALKRLSSF